MTNCCSSIGKGWLCGHEQVDVRLTENKPSQQALAVCTADGVSGVGFILANTFQDLNRVCNISDILLLHDPI